MHFWEIRRYKIAYLYLYSIDIDYIDEDLKRENIKDNA